MNFWNFGNFFWFLKILDFFFDVWKFWIFIDFWKFPNYFFMFLNNLPVKTASEKPISTFIFCNRTILWQNEAQKRRGDFHNFSKPKFQTYQKENLTLKSLEKVWNYVSKVARLFDPKQILGFPKVRPIELPGDTTLPKNLHIFTLRKFWKSG